MCQIDFNQNQPVKNFKVGNRQITVDKKILKEFLKENKFVFYPISGGNN